MGTALTAQTVASSYDSLLKVTDNGPVGGSLKTVTDGLGNDSALQVSTAGVKSLGTLEVAGVSAFAAGAVGAPAVYLSTDTTSGLYRIGANNLGVAISGSKVLDISSTGLAVTGTLSATGQISNAFGGFSFVGNSGSSYQLLRSTGATKNPAIVVSVTEASGDIAYDATGSTSGYAHVFKVEGTERARVSSTGLAVTGLTTTTTLRVSSIPTSASGLSSGDVWSDGGTLKIVA